MRRWRYRYVMLAALGVGVLMIAGCGKDLFPKDTPRTPYDRYETLHGESRPQSQHDARGREQPALRQRLAPLDQP